MTDEEAMDYLRNVEGFGITIDEARDAVGLPPLMADRKRLLPPQPSDAWVPINLFPPRPELGPAPAPPPQTWQSPPTPKQGPYR